MPSLVGDSCKPGLWAEAGQDLSSPMPPGLLTSFRNACPACGIPVMTDKVSGTLNYTCDPSIQINLACRDFEDNQFS